LPTTGTKTNRIYKIQTISQLNLFKPVKFTDKISENKNGSTFAPGEIRKLA
jgi:hypothetical protein